MNAERGQYDAPLTPLPKANRESVPPSLAMVLTVIIMSCMAAAYYYYERHYQNSFITSQNDRILAELNALQSRFDNALNRSLQIPNTLTSYIIARGDITEAEFMRLAQQLYAENAGSLRSIQVARGTTVTYLYPVQGNQQIAGVDLLTISGQADAVRETIRVKHALLAGPLVLVQGGTGAVIRKPIYLRGADGTEYYWGLATVVIDWPQFLEQAGLVQDNDGMLQFAIVESGGSNTSPIPIAGSSAVADMVPMTRKLRVPGRQWVLMANPSGDWMETAPDTWFLRSGALLIILAVGAFGIWRINYPTRLRREIETATHELQSIRDHLEQRVNERTREVVQSQRQLITLLDNIPFPLVVTKVEDGVNLYSNELASDLFEIEHGSTGQRAPDYYVRADDRRLFIEKLLASGRVINHEAHLQTSKKRNFYALLSAVRINYEGYDALLVCANDITERKRIEMALKTSEENFRKTFESVPTPTAITRFSDSKVLQLNPAARDLFKVENVPLGQLYARDFYANLEDRAEYLHKFEAEGGVKNFELRMKDYEGHEYDLLMASVPIEFADEEAVLISLTDITLHKKAERQLQKANLEARDAVRAKNEFLAIMSHEIRTPLNGVLTMLKVLERTELTPQQREYVETINLSGEALLTLLNDVLDLSKIEAGMLEISPVSFELASLVNDMTLLMRPLAERSRIALSASIDDALPHKLLGDATRIRQVLFNLLGNAIKFTERGAVELKVEQIASNQHDVTLKFSVRDTGIGISSHLQKRLFTTFTQVDSSIARRYGGTGLGLAICRRLVEAMGGGIGVESELNQGSTFWFTLQLRRDGNEIGSLQENHVPEKTQDLKWLKILLVEDNDINRRAASALLGMEGCQVVTATNGLDAISMADGAQFDVVLMDIHMPGIDGIETTRRLRKMAGAIAHTPIFALTADVTQENIVECLQAGIDAILTKPIDIKKMREALFSLEQTRRDGTSTSSIADVLSSEP